MEVGPERAPRPESVEKAALTVLSDILQVRMGLTRFNARIINIWERERILAHRNELQDCRCEIATLDLGRIVFDKLLKCVLREKAEALSLALQVSNDYPF